MSLLELKSKANKRKKIVGRGNASGRGTFCGRGSKGQRQRTGGKIAPGFEGGQTPYLRKMPKLKGFKNPERITYQIVKTDKLNVFANNDKVDTEVLFTKKLISKKNIPVKLLLGKDKLEKTLTIQVAKASKTAISAVEAVKGEVTFISK